MTEQRDVVIVGASLAGASCAIAAREASFGGSIALLGEEPHAPYSRPGLTKAVLRGEKSPDSTLVQPTSWYSYNNVGIGVTPNIKLARDAGLETDSGVLVNEFLHASAPDVYAIGDIAEYDSVLHDRLLRIEHWDVARQQGRYVGGRIAGHADGPYRVTPYFFSGLGDWLTMKYVGPGMGELIVRGSMDDDKFAAVYVKDGRLAACLTVNRDDDLEAARTLIGATIDIDKLRDEHTPIASAVLDRARSGS